MSEIWNLSTLCRCCHADGYFKSLKLTYQGKNDAEIYEVMLRETFEITISTPPLEASYTICDKCILKLRDATDFKKQVLMCEERFKVYCNNEQFLAAPDVKLEEENKDDFDYNDDLQTDVIVTLDVKKENQSLTKKIIVVTEKNLAEEITDRNTEVVNKNIKKLKTRRKQTSNKNIENENPRGKLDRSLIIQVHTESGIQYSCKDCGGCYHTRKEISNHMNKTHILFKCEYCPKQLKSYKNYKNHLKLHTGKELQCPFCPKKFASENAMRDHINSHTKEKLFRCDLCQKDFKYKQTLSKHLKIHAGTNKKILCDVCGWSFNDQSNLNAHIRSVHEKLRPYQCLKCGKSYSNKRHLNDHIKFHDGDDKFYKCDVCDRRLSCPKIMKIHRLKHDNKFMCRYCFKVFDDARLRSEHVNTVHHQNFSCSICGKVLAGTYSLKRHLDDHKGIKRFSCDFCGLKFSQKSVLDRHIFRKHNPDADINAGKTKCEICKRSFKNIIVHMDNHKNRRCACDICGKTYPHNSALRRHKSLKHYGRSFDCDMCDKKYMQNAKLNTHRLKVHKITTEKDKTESSVDDKLACPQHATVTTG